MKKSRSILILVLMASLGLLVPGKAAVSQQTAGELFEKALYVEEGQGDLQKAIAFYQDIVKRFPDSREVAAKAQLHIGLCLEKLGLQEAEKAYQKVVSDFPEQKEPVQRAREKLALLVKARLVLDTASKGLNVRLIWSGPDAESVGQASPDGKSLSFIEKETGNLCIKEIASGKQIVVVRRNLLGKPYEFPVSSRWSPDGSSLAYGWFNRDNSVELRTIGIDGSNARILYAQKNEMVFPMAWSPDGRFIAASLMRDFYKSYNVSLIAVEDGSVKVLKTPKLLETAPKNMTFSPDSHYLVIDLPQGEDDPKHDIFALSVDGAQEFRVIEHPGEDTVLGWIPDSDSLLFSSDRTGTHDAWIVDVADGRPHGEPRLVRKNLGQVTPLGISREGSLFYSLEITMWDIFTACIDLEKRSVIEPSKILPQPLVGADHQPQWSPDGKYLAFFSIGKAEPGARGRMALKIRSEETGETREIITNLRWLARPCWAPDGRSLFVIGSDGKNTLALFQVQVQTGQTTFLINSEAGSNIKFIAPAPDGKSVFYTYFEFAKKRCRIMGIDLSTRETRELYRQEAPPDIGGLGVSPDGKQLVFGTLTPDDSSVLKAIPLPGGPPREIIKSKASAFCWTPDGKRILFFRDIRQGQDKKSQLCSVPVEGGEIQSHELVVAGSPDALNLHPNGRSLAFSVSRSAAEIWVMENFLPREKK